MAVAPTQETVNKLLDFNQKLDIGLLDTVVGTLYAGTGEQQKMAQEVLTTLKEHPDAWTKVSFTQFLTKKWYFEVFVYFPPFPEIFSIFLRTKICSTFHGKTKCLHFEF